MESLRILTKMMTNKYKILANFIKDMSSETTDIQSYLFVKENISKYQLNIDITSKALKNNMIEVSTILKFEDKELNEKKSHFEIVYISIIKVDEDIKEDKKVLKKLILCDLQKEVYPKIERCFLDLLHNSGFPEVKLEKKIDFDKLYNQKFN
jgi:preprotein translocase subunit SecB